MANHYILNNSTVLIMPFMFVKSNTIHYYFYNQQGNDSFLSSFCNAIEIDSKELSRINFGAFNKDGHFIENNFNGIQVGDCFFWDFKLVYNSLDLDTQDFQIQYSTGISKGVICFAIYKISEMQIVNFLSKFIPFVCQNTDLIVEKGFVMQKIDLHSFFLTLEDNLTLIDNLEFQLKESSLYVARKDNKFYDDIIVSIPKNANRYFKAILFDFCKSISREIVTYDEQNNTIVYRKDEYSAWTQSYEVRVSSYDWKNEKPKFILFLVTSYSFNAMIKKILLND